MQSIQEIDGDLGRVKWSDIYEDPVETRRDQRNANPVSAWHCNLKTPSLILTSPYSLLLNNISS